MITTTKLLDQSYIITFTKKRKNLDKLNIAYEFLENVDFTIHTIGYSKSIHRRCILSQHL